MREILYIVPLLLIISCGEGESGPDAYGNFSATEILISAESTGKIIQKNVKEGEVISAGAVAYLVDTVQIHLKKKEVIAKNMGVRARKRNIEAQIAVLEEQLASLIKDRERFGILLAEGAATQKQVDDLDNRIAVMKKQIHQTQTNFASIDAEIIAGNAILEQLDDMTRRARIAAPVNGTILQTYAEMGETVAPGKPLFKLADLSNMELKAYFSSSQLADIKLGDGVEVRVDDANMGLKSYEGRITWISPKAEFTPKIIQTREERVNLVYAVKIKVRNDGTLHINMPGEVLLSHKGAK